MWKQLAINGGPAACGGFHLEDRHFPGAAAAAAEVCNSGQYLEWYGGRQVREFEARFSQYHSRGHGVLMSSGTAALHAAYFALEIGAGDEVILPALTFIADASMLLQVGAMPVYAEVDPRTWVLDPADVERHITSKTKAIVAVHMFGQPVNMPAILDIAKRHGCFVIEDCGQAHGARIGDRLVGTFGEIGSFSLAIRKHVTTGGQGGINILDDPERESRMRPFIHYGKRDRHDFVSEGFNYQITELQAAVGLASLDQLDVELARMRENARVLREALSDVGLQLDHEWDGTFHAAFKVAFLIPTEFKHLRDWFSSALAAEGVPNMYYPLLPSVAWMQRHPYRWESRGISENVAQRLTTIPTAFASSHISMVAEAIKKVVAALPEAASCVVG